MGLEDASGKYDMVTCIDVMIHYPKDRVDDMINHLAGLSSKKLIISFAPKTMAYLILKRVGELFPGPSKATRAYSSTMSLTSKSPSRLPVSRSSAAR